MPIGPDHGAPYFGDIDGDGMADVLIPRGPDGADILRVGGSPPDRLVGVHAWNNSVKSVELAYGQLSDGGVYSADSTCGLRDGTVCLRGGTTSVVRRVSYDMGAGVARSDTTYQYANGRREQQTHRWLGFERVKETEVRSGEVTTSEYDLTTRTGPHGLLTRLGRLLRRTVETPLTSGMTTRWRIATETFAYATLDLAGGFLTYERESVRALYERATRGPCAAPQDCRPLESTSTTVLSTDTLGYPTGLEQVGVTVQQRSLTYAPHDRAQWIFGRIETERVTDYTPDAAGTRSRFRAWTYRGATPRVWTYTVREDGDPRQLVTRFTYDDYGNRRSTCVRDVANDEERCTVIDYDSVASMWPVRVTNPLGHVFTVVVHPLFGQPRQLVTPNGEVQSVQFDTVGRVVLTVAPDGSTTSDEYAMETAPGPIEGKVIRRSTLAPAVTTGLDRLGRPRTTSWASYHDRAKRHVIQRDYDAAGLLRQVKGPYFVDATSGARLPPAPGEPEQPLVQMEYDALDRPTRMTEASGAETRWLYEPGLGATEPSRRTIGQRVRRIDPNGHAEVVETNGGGQVERVVDALGGTTRFQYGAFGLPTASIDALQQTSTFEYDAYGIREASTDPTLGRQVLDVDAFSQVRGVIDEATGLRTAFVYDALGRLIHRTVGAEKSSWTYDVSETCAGSLTCAASEHTLGRLVSSTGADLDGRRYQYDAAGRVSAETHVIRALPYTYEYEYDAAGRLDGLTYPMAADGWRLRLRHEYVNGQLAIVRNAADGNALWVKESVTAAAQTKRVSLGNQLATTWQYTREGRVAAATTGATGQAPLSAMGYDYDLAGNLIGRRDLRQSMTERFVYDALDRLTSNCFVGGVTPVPPPVPATMDAAQRAAMSGTDVADRGPQGPTQNPPAPTDATQVSNWASYSSSPLTGPQETAIALSSRMPLGSEGIFAADTQYRQCSSYAYDALGNFEWREGVGAYEYPALTEGGREIYAPSRVVHPSGSTSVEYTDAGRIKTLGSSLYTYTAQGLLRAVELRPGTLRAQTSPVRTTFRYDADGTRTEKQTGASITTYAGALFEQEMSATGSVPAALTFDANTREARLKLVADGAAFAQVVHHVGALRATALDPTRSPWVSAAGLPPPLSSAALDRVQVAATAGTTTIVYLHPDPQGTPELLTDAGLAAGVGRVVERRSYDPFGRLRSSDWSRGMEAPAVGRRTVGFTGHPEDEETGLIAMAARTYSPTLGRFLTPDSIVANPLNTQSHNRYAYVDNNPLRYTDPSGFAPVDVQVKKTTLVFDEHVVTAKKKLRKPLRPVEVASTAAATVVEPPPPPPEPDEGPRVLPPKLQVQSPGALLKLYRAYRDAIGAINQAGQDQARDAADFVHDLTGSALAAGYTATYIEGTWGGATGILGIGLLPEAVWNSADEFDHGLWLLADGTEQGDPYRAFMGVAAIAGAAGTVAGAVVTVAGGVTAAKARLTGGGGAGGGGGGSAGGGGGGGRPSFLNLGEPAPGRTVGRVTVGDGGTYRLANGEPIAPGSYDFVVQNGEISIGKGHYSLARGGPVEYAGEITFSRGGAIERWSNASGHYRPSASFSGNAGLPASLFTPVQFPALVGSPQLPVFRGP